MMTLRLVVDVSTKMRKSFSLKVYFHSIYFLLTSFVQTNYDNRSFWRKFSELRDPLGSNILVRGKGANTETHKEHIRLRITKRSEIQNIGIIYRVVINERFKV